MVFFTGPDGRQTMFTFTLTLDPALRIPMYEQLYTAIAGAIRGGALLHGEKLPSKRALCDQLGVSRATVETAYELLTAEGYVESRPRRLPGPEPSPARAAESAAGGHRDSPPAGYSVRNSRPPEIGP